MRQRTKVGKPLYYVELVGEESGAQIARWPSVSGVSRERAVDQASAWRTGLHPESDPKVVRIVKVTTVRLAPLVVLPAWEKRGGSWVTQLGEVHGTYYERDGRWIATAASVDWCRGAEFTEHATIDEARAACERRLRELGFRVTKAKKAGTS